MGRAIQPQPVLGASLLTWTTSALRLVQASPCWWHFTHLILALKSFAKMIKMSAKPCRSTQQYSILTVNTWPDIPKPLLVTQLIFLSFKAAFPLGWLISLKLHIELMKRQVTHVKSYVKQLWERHRNSRMWLCAPRCRWQAGRQWTSSGFQQLCRSSCLSGLQALVFYLQFSLSTFWSTRAAWYFLFHIPQWIHLTGYDVCISLEQLHWAML